MHYEGWGEVCAHAECSLGTDLESACHGLRGVSVNLQSHLDLITHPEKEIHLQGSSSRVLPAMGCDIPECLKLLGLPASSLCL